MAKLKIGIVGSTSTNFSESEARTALENTVSQIQSEHGGTPVIVSELMNIGVNRLAYEFAENSGYETYGILDKRREGTEEYEDVDNRIIDGETYGDHYDRFFKEIDVFFRLGGSDTARKNAAIAESKGIPVYEVNL